MVQPRAATVQTNHMAHIQSCYGGGEVRELGEVWHSGTDQQTRSHKGVKARTSELDVTFEPRFNCTTTPASGCLQICGEPTWQPGYEGASNRAGGTKRQEVTKLNQDYPPCQQRHQQYQTQLNSSINPGFSRASFRTLQAPALWANGTYNKVLQCTIKGGAVDEDLAEAFNVSGASCCMAGYQA